MKSWFFSKASFSFGQDYTVSNFMVL